MQNISKNEVIAISLAIVVVVYMVFFYSPKTGNEVASETNTLGQTKEELTATAQDAQINNEQNQKVMPEVNELQKQILQEGTGAEAVVGSIVSVHYTGALTDGTVFDSSIPRGTPFEFRLGEGSVIAGWEEGVKGMKVGEKRRLVIPSNMGYGSQGAGGVIPPNATLIFDIELLGVK